MSNRNTPCFCGSGKKTKKCHPDILENSVFAELIKLYNKIDKSIANNKQLNSKCKKGCSECCSQNFGISSIEFLYILSNVINKDKDEAWSLLEKGYNLWLKFKLENKELSIGLEDTSENKDKTIESDINFYDSVEYFLPCIFLDNETNSCTVYENRPIVCRYYGLGYIEKQNNLSNLTFCKNTEPGIPLDNLTDLTEYQQDIYKVNKYITKDNQTMLERIYPIFYFCKIHYNEHNNHNKLLLKITELKKYSFSEISEIKFRRYLNRH